MVDFCNIWLRFSEFYGHMLCVNFVLRQFLSVDRLQLFKSVFETCCRALFNQNFYTA